MAVAFDTSASGYTRTTVSDGSSNATLTVNVPANVVNGDLMIAVIHNNHVANPGSITPPGAFTELANNFSENGNFAMHSWVGYRIASSEPASYDWTIDAGTADDHGWIFRVTGHDGASPIDGTGTIFSGSTAGNASVNSVTTSYSNTVVFWLFGGKNGSNLVADDTAVSPSEAVQILYKKSRTNSAGVGSAFARELRASSGATGSRTFTGIYGGSSGYYATFGFGIREGATATSAPYIALTPQRNVRHTGRY